MILDSLGGVFDALSAGVPNLSTPSRAAVMIALPRLEGSKRAGRWAVLRVAAEEREPMLVGIGTLPPIPPPITSGVNIGEAF